MNYALHADNTEQIAAIYLPSLIKGTPINSKASFNYISEWTQSNSVNKIKKKMETTSRYVKISNLINFNYELKKSIEVQITKDIYSGDVIGDIKPLELYSFGKDEFEVLRELNKDLTDLFQELINMQDTQLGKFPKKWKAILKEYIHEN